jgi:hypothetical protein
MVPSGYDLAWLLAPDPVNRGHPLNAGRLAWWLVVPQFVGGTTWYDLMGLYPATLSGFDATHGWQSIARQGGWGGLSYDGTNATAQAPAAAALSITGDITIAAWVSVPSFSATTVALDKGNASASNATYGFGWTGAGVLNFVHSNNFVASSGYTLASATWLRLFMARTVSNTTVTYYANGAQVGSASYGATVPVANSQTLGLGTEGNSDTHFRTALSLDDVSIWSRACSAAEARADYDLSRTGYPGVLSRWRPRRAAGAAILYMPWIYGDQIESNAQG